MQETSPQRDLGAVSPVLDARTNILSIMPRIIASLTSMWHAMAVIEGQEDSPKLTMGAVKVNLLHCIPVCQSDKIYYKLTLAH